MERLKRVLAILSLTVVLVACGNQNSEQNDRSPADGSETEEVGQQEVEFTDEEKLNEDMIVATINDIEITGDMFNLIYVQTKIQLNQTGQDISDLQYVRQLALDGLINQEIIRQDAKKAGIVVTDEELLSEFESIKSDNEERFQAFLKQYHLTEQAFKEQLLFALTHDKYIESELPPVKVTDEEVEGAYNEIKKDNKDIAKLEDVEEQLRSEMILQKEQESLQNRIEELKKQVTIEKHL